MQIKECKKDIYICKECDSRKRTRKEDKQESYLRSTKVQNFHFNFVNHCKNQSQIFTQKLKIIKKTSLTDLSS
jgi:hypothetical protein